LKIIIDLDAQFDNVLVVQTTKGRKTMAKKNKAIVETEEMKKNAIRKNEYINEEANKKENEVFMTSDEILTAQEKELDISEANEAEENAKFDAELEEFDRELIDPADEVYENPEEIMKRISKGVKEIREEA
jgi:hypothetical protein